MPRVLVVNDAERTRPIAARMLERLGYRVDIAADGADAIDRLGEFDYDALILDVAMPRVDGHGVLIHLARTNPTMIGRTVLVASVAQEASESQLDEVCRVLVKPVGVEKLLAAIDECLVA
jgi:two-component system response regulator PilR (NtrC family)